MTAVLTAVKAISSAVRRAGFVDMFGMAGKTNVQGEDVKKLDVMANELFQNMIRSSFNACLMISEENDEPIEIEFDKQGKYIVCFDPLDGSSNIDCLVSVGTIFSIFRKESTEPATQHDALQSGRKIVAAGYALYGSATMVVLTVGAGVNSFMLDPSIGEFLLIEDNMKIKPRGNIYSLNEGNERDWHEPVRQYIHSLKYPKDGGKPYAARYTGSMVADMHRTLKYGGIFGYPGTIDNPQGKLRLLYEVIPMAYIIEQAGGMASTGSRPVLDIQPDSIHQRVPCWIGSKEDVQEIIDFFTKSGLQA
jgi:fructose-1,6-bisphosphatase I